MHARQKLIAATMTTTVVDDGEEYTFMWHCCASYMYQEEATSRA